MKLRDRLARFLLIGACALLAASPARGQDERDPRVSASGEAAAPLPDGGVSLLGSDPLGGMKLAGRAAGQAEVEQVAVEGQPFATALRVRTRARNVGDDAVVLVADTAAPFKSGDTLFLRLYVRTLETEAASGQGSIFPVLQQNSAPYEPAFFSARLSAGVGQGWQRLDLPIPARLGYGAGGARLAVLLGGVPPQVVEIGGVELLSYGRRVQPWQLPFRRATYAGREPDAPWRQAAADRIEQIRKGNLTVVVTDRDGAPIEGTEVAVRMRRHAYQFGTAINDGSLMPAEGSPDVATYREVVKQLFNHAVLEGGHKWPAWEQPAARERTIAAVQWLRDNGLSVRGHTLVWPSWRRSPSDLQGLKDDPAALARRVRDHIAEEARFFGGQLTDWDVVNETFANHDLMDVLGEGAMVEWFKTAHEADPAAVLYLNENSVISGRKIDHFERHVRLLLDGGAPLGGIGEQGHGGALPVQRVLDNLDRLARFGLPIKITEFDIVTPDEELQADWTRDFMTAAFSHPATVGFVMWGFWDGAHWLHDAPLFYRDWTLKPSGQAWIDLVFDQWWTDVIGATDAGGAYTTRGFFGEYEIEVRRAGRVKTVQTALPSAGQTVRITLD